MRILVLGASGMLGSDVAETLTGHETATPSSAELDITDPSSVAQIQAGNYDWCVTCAAYTAVDKAETERQQAYELNALGPAYLARACAMAGTKLIHLSTDFVFDGQADEPYTEDSPTNPLGYYGETKRQGEVAILEANPNAIILRTAWLYGANGASFPRTMIRAYEAGKQLRVVADQIGCPTYTADLAMTVKALIEHNAFPGIYHAVGPDSMTWFEFAKETLEVWQETTDSEWNIDILPIATEDWPTPAKRPKYSVLSTEKLERLGIPPMRPTSEALREFCNRLKAKDPL